MQPSNAQILAVGASAAMGLAGAAAWQSQNDIAVGMLGATVGVWTCACTYLLHQHRVARRRIWTPAGAIPRPIVVPERGALKVDRAAVRSFGAPHLVPVQWSRPIPAGREAIAPQAVIELSAVLAISPGVLAVRSAPIAQGNTALGCKGQLTEDAEALLRSKADQFELGSPAATLPTGRVQGDYHAAFLISDSDANEVSFDGPLEMVEKLQSEFDPKFGTVEFNTTHNDQVFSANGFVDFMVPGRATQAQLDKFFNQRRQELKATGWTLLPAARAA